MLKSQLVNLSRNKGVNLRVTEKNIRKEVINIIIFNFLIVPISISNFETFKRNNKR